MAKHPDPRQPSFFDIPDAPSRAPASLNIAAELRAGIAQAIKECPKSRPQIAAEMTELLWGDAAGEEGEVTVHMLNAWTAPSRTEWRFPLEYLPAFVVATGGIAVLDRIATKCGCKILVGEEGLVIKLAISLAQERKWAATRSALQKAVPHETLERLIKRAGGQP